MFIEMVRFLLEIGEVPKAMATRSSHKSILEETAIPGPEAQISVWTMGTGSPNFKTTELVELGK